MSTPHLTPEDEAKAKATAEGILEAYKSLYKQKNPMYETRQDLIDDNHAYRSVSRDPKTHYRDERGRLIDMRAADLVDEALKSFE